MLPLPHHGFFYGEFTGDPVCRILGKKYETDGVLPRLGKCDVTGGHFFAIEPVRDLEQHACTVAGEWVSSDGTTMGEVRQHGESLFDDQVALAPLDVCDEPDTARVVVETSVIQAPRPVPLYVICLHIPFPHIPDTSRLPASSM